MPIDSEHCTPGLEVPHRSGSGRARGPGQRTPRWRAAGQRSREEAVRIVEKNAMVGRIAVARPCSGARLSRVMRRGGSRNFTPDNPAERRRSMTRHRKRSSLRWMIVGVVVLAIGLAGTTPSLVQGAAPIRIGMGMALTGGLAANGKAALLAMQIWKDDVNKKGGLLGRPVELVYYDDQTNPATVPQIYTKLLDVDKVDIVISGYGTNLIAPL